MQASNLIDTDYLTADFLQAVKYYIPTNTSFSWFDITTPQLDSLLTSLAETFAKQEERRLLLRFNTLLEYAKASDLDTLAADFNITRLADETDAKFYSRVKLYILGERCTVSGISAFIKSIGYLDTEFTITESWRSLKPVDGDVGVVSPKRDGFRADYDITPYGNTIQPGYIQIALVTPSTDDPRYESLLELLDLVVASGVKVTFTMLNLSILSNTLNTFTITTTPTVIINTEEADIFTNEFSAEFASQTNNLNIYMFDSVTPITATITSGDYIKTFTLSLDRTNLPDTVTFSAQGLPAGASASFTPMTTNGNTTTVTLTFSPGTATGTYPIVLIANAGNKQAQINVNVTRTGGTLTGQPMGLLLAFTYS